jgi:HK97 family phage major capsid protein
MPYYDEGSINETLLTAVKEVGRVGVEAKQLHDEVRARVKAVEASTTDVQNRIDGIETAMNRAGHSVASAGAPSAEAKAHAAAFDSFLRKGSTHGLAAISETKTLMVSSDQDGGYLAPAELSAKIIARVSEISPIRRIASVVNTGAPQVEHIVDNDDLDAVWVSETDARPAGRTPKLGKKVISVHELLASPAATTQFLEDSVWDVDAWLARKASTKFAQTEGRAFLTGTGKGMPRGMLTYPSAPGTQDNGWYVTQLPSGSASGFAPDGLLTATYAIKSAYRANASWLMSRAVALEVRKLKDSDGNYLWQRGLQQGQPDLLLGYPINECEDMPAVATGSLSIAFGDFNAGYEIVDRIGISVTRDPFSVKPLVQFDTRKRVGGDVINCEAFVLIRTGVA